MLYEIGSNTEPKLLYSVLLGSRCFKINRKWGKSSVILVLNTIVNTPKCAYKYPIRRFLVKKTFCIKFNFREAIN